MHCALVTDAFDIHSSDVLIKSHFSLQCCYQYVTSQNCSYITALIQHLLFVKLPSGGHCQTLLCIQCMVGFLHSWGHTVNNSLHPPQHTPRLLHHGPCRYHEHILYTADHTLFRLILTNPNHVLVYVLPETASMDYRQHDRQLIPKTTELHICNFIIRIYALQTFILIFHFF